MWKRRDFWYICAAVMEFVIFGLFGAILFAIRRIRSALTGRAFAAARR
jgi:hypothetical protein